MKKMIYATLLAKEGLVVLEISLIYGLMFGIAHTSGEEEDLFNWAITIALGPIEISLISVK